MRSIIICLCFLPLQALASSPPYHKIADVSLAGTLALQHYRLANGLQVAIIEDDTRPVITCHLAYRVGSAHESPGQQGMAHLVEHLAMDRTYFESLGLLGAPHANASTSRDGTKYYATVPKARLDTLIAYFARDMTQFNISQKEYDLEKEVVLSEWARSAKSARRWLYKKLYARMFAGHPYQYDILGHPDTIRAFTLERAIAFHERYYAPNNACLAIVGDVKAAEILPVVLQHFAGIPKRVGRIHAEVDTSQAASIPQDSIGTTSGLHSRVWGVWKIPIDRHSDSRALYLFDQVLFEGEYSPADQKLVGSGKVLWISSHFLILRDRALYYYIAELPSGAPYEPVRDAMQQTIQTTIDSLSEENLLLARNEARRILYRTMISQTRLATNISNAFIRTDDPAYGLKWMQGFDGITVADVRRVATRYLSGQPPRTFVLTAVTEPPSRRAWLYAGIVWIIIGIVGCWYLRRHVLAVGAMLIACSAATAEIPNHKMYYVQDLRVPQTGISMVYFTGGHRRETRDTCGLTFAFYRLYPLALHGDDLKEMDRLGAEFWINISDRAVTVGIATFSENLDAALRRLKKMLDNLTFSEALLDRERARIIDDFEDHIDDREMTETFRYHLYEAEEDRRRGTRTALENLTAEHLQRFWDQTLRAKVLYFKVTSDLGAADIERHLQVIAQGRPRDGFAPHPRPKRKTIAGLRALLSPSSHAADFCHWITNGLPRTDADWFAQTLLVDALNRLLFTRLREQNGWCYSTGARIDTWPSPPVLRFWANPQGVHTAKLIPEMFRLIHHCLAEPDFWQQVAKSRERLKRAYHLQLGPFARLNQQVRHDRDGVPMRSLAEFESAIDQVTKEDIRRVFGHFTNDRGKLPLLLLFYGNSDRIQDALEHEDIQLKPTIFGLQTLIK